MTLAFAQVLHRLAPVSGPFVGRSAELDRLREAWRRAASGRGGVVLLAGEAGVGKTRLVAELAGDVEAAGATVAVGGCPAGGAEPYHPLVEALGPLPDGGGGREAMFDALAGAVAARARRAPMLLVLDDVHRADRSTLLAVRRIMEAAPRCPLLVVITFRDVVVDRSHPLGEFLATVLTRPGVERIRVGGLSPEELVELIGDAELARRLWRQSEGNPVRFGELLRGGALESSVPPRFDDLVARRVEALSPPARALVEAAAVSGSEFRVDVAAAAAGVRADRVPAALKQVVAAGVIVSEPIGPDDTRRFVHDMVREAVERRLDSAARVELHARVGRTLDRLGPSAGVPAALLAWHFRAAAPVGGSAAARAHSVRAGDRAMELLAWEEAAVHYGHALAAAMGVAPEVRTELLLSLGEAQRLAGEAARARQAFLEAATLARSCSDGARMARAALALGQVAAVWGADPELEGLAGEASALLGRATPVASPLASADFFASDALYDALDRGGPDPAPADAVAPGDRGERSATAALLRARHVALSGPEHTADRLAAAEELVALAMAVGDDELAATARGWRLADGLELGQLEQVVADQAAHAALARHLDDPCVARDAAAWSAMTAMLEGRVDEARSAAADAFALAVDAGDPEADDAFLMRRWWLALEWATSEDLCDVAEACRVQASTTARGQSWRAAAALALARAGRFDLTAEELRRVTDNGLGELIRDPGRLHPLASLAEAAWIVGDGGRAAAVGALLEPFSDHVVVAGRAVLCQGSAARAGGLVAAAAHRWDDAERHFRSALLVHQRLGALPLLARTQFEWSRVLLARRQRGDRRQAAEWRRKAAGLANGLGMSRLSEEIAAPAT